MDTQPQLIDVPAGTPPATLPVPVKEYTGDLFFANNPEAYQLMVKHLGDGVGLLKIARMMGVSVHTVIAVRDREPQRVAILKERIASLARTAGQLAIERAIEDLGDPDADISTRDDAIIAGIMLEKAELLSGAATSRIEVVRPEPAGADFQDYLDSLPRVSVVEDGVPPQKERDTRLLGQAKEEKDGPGDPGGSAGSTGADVGDVDKAGI